MMDQCKPISHLLDIISEPARIQILFALGNGESCVCHLEAALQMRQAAISQHLMVLRHGGIVSTLREGRHIFYHLDEPGVLSLLQQAASLKGVSTESIQSSGKIPVPDCSCPKCNPTLESKLVCKKGSKK